MKLRKFVLLVLAVAVISACSFFSGLLPASGNAAKYQYIFKTPAKALRLSLELDTAHSAQATIGPAGGKISTKGADGTLYTLEIPKKALINAAKISLTPLSKLSGMPFDGKTSHAVQIEPEGLYLYYDAILTITPAKPIPLAQQLFFGYQGDGRNVSLAIPDKKSKDIKLHLMHFSGYGVADGSAADTAAIEGQLGGDARSALQSLTAEAIARARESLDNGNADAGVELGKTILELMDQWEKDVVQPALDAAGTSCQAGKDAMRDLIDLERMRQLLGVDSSPASMAKIFELAQSGAIVCIKEEYQRCVNDHVITGMIPWYVDQLRARELGMDGGGGSGAEKEGLILARDLTTKCLTFELQFHSEGSFVDGEAGYSSAVDGRIKLHFDPNTFTIKGNGPLDNLSFEFRTPKGGKGMSCTVTSKTGGSTFETKALEYVQEQRDQVDPNSPPQYYLKDFNLLYFPGVTSESYSAHCILTDSQGHQSTNDFAAPPSGYWTGIFFTVHKDELNAGSAGPIKSGPPPMPDMSGIAIGAMPPMPAPEMPADGGFFINEFDMTPGDALIASKEWIKEVASVNLTETGTIKIVHKPGE
jgi:hypothetical protein